MHRDGGFLAHFTKAGLYGDFQAATALSHVMPLLGEDEVENVWHKLSRLCWKEIVHHRHQAIKVVEESIDCIEF